MTSLLKRVIETGSAAPRDVIKHELAAVIEGASASIDASHVITTSVRVPALRKVVSGAVYSIAYIACATFLLETIVSSARRDASPFTVLSPVLVLIVWNVLTKVSLIAYGLDLYPSLYKEMETALGGPPGGGEVQLRTSESILLVVAEIVWMLVVDLFQLLPWRSTIRLIVNRLLNVLVTPAIVAVVVVDPTQSATSRGAMTRTLEEGWSTHFVLATMISSAIIGAVWVVLITIDALNYSLNCFHFRLSCRREGSLMKILEHFERRSAFFFGYAIVMLCVKYSLAYYWQPAGWVQGLAFNIIFSFNVMTSVTSIYGHKPMTEIVEVGSGTSSFAAAAASSSPPQQPPAGRPSPSTLAARKVLGVRIYFASALVRFLDRLVSRGLGSRMGGAGTGGVPTPSTLSGSASPSPAGAGVPTTASPFPLAPAAATPAPRFRVGDVDN